MVVNDRSINLRESRGEISPVSIKKYGIDTIFTLPGAQLDNLFNALYDEQDSIRTIHKKIISINGHDFTLTLQHWGLVIQQPVPQYS